MEATAADWITAAFTAVLALFTLALVVATGYYAKQTRRMLGEMRASREQAIRPKLALALRYHTPTFAAIAVKNVGPGAALEADLEFAFGPGAHGQQTREVKPWRTNLIASGEEHCFLPPAGPDGSALEVKGLAAAFEQIELTGTVRDALGTLHQVGDRFEDLPSFYERNKAAQHVIREDETVRALKEQVGEPIVEELRELRRVVEQFRRPPTSERDEEPWE